MEALKVPLIFSGVMLNTDRGSLAVALNKPLVDLGGLKQY